MRLGMMHLVAIHDHPEIRAQAAPIQHKIHVRGFGVAGQANRFPRMTLQKLAHAGHQCFRQPGSQHLPEQFLLGGPVGGNSPQGSIADRRSRE
jgi:hypothetical protein